VKLGRSSKASAGKPSSDPGRNRGDRGLAVSKILAVSTAAIAAIGGGITLLFRLDPGLQPCIGGSAASLTQAVVFPNITYRHFMETMKGLTRKTIQQLGGSQYVAQRAPSCNTKGAEVRFSYSANNLRGAELQLYYSLATVGAGGIVNGVVPKKDQVKAEFNLSTNGCAEDGGYDLFVPTPHPDPSKRYRIVLELYNGPAKQPLRTNRLGLVETPVFSG
jgi:hypothetical protein